MNNNILRDLSYGVYIISTLDGDRATGCVANSAMQITSSPATIAVSINHDNFTNECIRKSGRFSVSILSQESDPGLIGTFGFQSGKDVDKYEKVEHEVVENVPVIKDSCGYMVCELKDSFETSTHTIFIGEIVEGDVYSNVEPMTYAYYHKVVKGKSPKNAPTYIPDEKEESAESKVIYQCSICGYIYEGSTPFEQLPEDYVCPICKQPKSVFEKKTI